MEIWNKFEYLNHEEEYQKYINAESLTIIRQTWVKSQIRDSKIPEFLFQFDSFMNAFP